MEFDKLAVVKKINAGFEEKGFLEQSIHQNALKDFKFLCQKTGYTTFNNLNFQTLRTADNHNRYLGEFLVLGYDVTEKKVTFPAGLLDIGNDKCFVAAVCYSNGSVQDVLVFSATEFKKAGVFSMFKSLKKEGALSIGIGSPDSKNLKQYSFGYVLNKL